jgi:site-specific DNA-cytosine methylase
MNDDKYERDHLRRGKEFVYEQWRKLLCIFVVGDDINTNQFTPEEVTSEKIRTIFDNGYKLAMLQTRVSLKKELFSSQEPSQSYMIERLINQIEDRLETHKCLVSYSANHDKLLYDDAVKRDEEFLRYAKEDVTKWGDKQKIDTLKTINAEKSFCLTTNKSHSKNYYLTPDKTMARMLERDEVERLQTIPNGYTNIVSKTDAHKMIGNGWTVDVIAHIFSFLKGEEIFNNFSNENV